MARIYIIPTDGLPPDTGYLEIMAMTEDDIAKLPHVTLTLSEFENEWNDDLKGQFDSTQQFIRVFYRVMRLNPYPWHHTGRYSGALPGHCIRQGLHS